jgi:iron(III) transport system substrate-binding protein
MTLRAKALLAALLVAAAALALAWGGPRRAGEVAVYTSVDSEYAQPLAERFTQRTGIPVSLRTDSEGTKTTGMLARLRQFKGRPDGDVFWNNEQSATLLLAKEGLLEPYVSPRAAAIPEPYKDPRGLWTGFGLRARVLIYNTRHVKPEEAPKSFEQLTDAKWRGRFCLATPLFGTTRSHLVALVLALGEEQGFELLRRLRENGSAGGTRPDWLQPGNSKTRDRVAEGYFHLGLTDTDDVYSALERGQPVQMVFLEQTAEWPGVFLIPNTVALLKGGPNPEAARKFVDFLLDPETEEWLAAQGARQIPVRGNVAVPQGHPRLSDLKSAQVDPVKLQAQIEPLSERIDRLLRGVDR